MALCWQCFREIGSRSPCPHCGYDAAENRRRFPLALPPGSILNGRYTTGRVLGQGGFGITYLALDDRSGERVAIKEYFPTEFAGRPDGRSVQVFSEDRRENFDYGRTQFLEEAKTIAALNGNAHIVRVYSYFEENGTAYFAMEYAEGLPLDKYLAQKGGRLTAEEENRLLLPLMEAMDEVHAKGIVHRDIAPDNIIVQPDGTAKLIDFGAARYSTGEKSRSLDVILKHGFAPYEQYMRRGRQGPWTDVYAMAATYYYAVTGRVPPEAVERRNEDELIPPSTLGAKISPAQEDVLLRALEVLAPERWQSMAAFRQAMLAASPKTEQEELARRERELREELARVEKSRREQEQAAREEAERREEEAARKKEAGRREEKARTAAPPPEQEKPKKSKALPILVALLAVAAAIFLIVTKLVLPGSAYNEALRLKEAGRYEEAIAAFEALGDYKDSAEQISACEKGIIEDRYQAAEALAAEGKLEEAVEAFRSLGGYKDSAARADALFETFKRQRLLSASVGDTVYFGSYEQDNNRENGAEPIEWLVLEKTDDSLLVISRYALDCKPYNTRRTSVTWETCTLRGWLNRDFLNAAFSSEEQAQIPTVTVSADRNPYYSTDPGNSTQDKVFLLSIPEAEKTFASDEAHRCEPTAYAKAGGCYVSNGLCWWWLRSPGFSSDGAAVVGLGGSVGAHGTGVDNVNYAVRPALRIDLAEYRKQALKAASIGDTVYFGSYEQDNNTENGAEPIEWLVLEKTDDSLLVISRYGLDCKQYNTSQTPVTWESCSLRTWLNSDFLNAAFSAEEQALIPTVTVSADKNPKYITSPGNSTQDRVFLLSIPEAENYFSSESERQCEATAYAKENGCYVNKGDFCWWWLRSPGNHSSSAAYVYTAGSVNSSGYVVNFDDLAVRPALRIDLAS